MTKEQSQIEIISADSLKERLKQTFVGRPPQPSERRQYLQDLAFLRPSDEGLRVLTELPTTQLALVLPEEIVSMASAVERTIEESGASQEDVQEAKEMAFQAFVWSQKPENKGTGKAFNFGPLRRPVEKLVAVFAALLLVLTLSLTACAADTNNEPIKPTVVLATGETPLNGGGGGETIEPQRFAVFDSARNYRTGPSATAAKTQLDGKSTTTPGKEYEYFQRVVNPDGSVWLRLSADSVKPEVWAVLIHPTLKLTGTELQPATEPEGGPQLTEEQKVVLVADFNRVATLVDASIAVTLTQNADDSIVYFDANGKSVGIARPVLNPVAGGATAELFTTTADGTPDRLIALDTGTGKWLPLTTEAPAQPAKPDAVATPAVTTTENIGSTVAAETAAPSETLSPEASMRALFPENFEEYFAAKKMTLKFDTAKNLFFATNAKGERFAVFPHASAGDPEKDLDVSTSYYEATESTLTSTRKCELNPNGVKRELSIFVSTEHVFADGYAYINPDLIKNQDALLRDIALYIFNGDQQKADTLGFTLYINLAAGQNVDYVRRDSEDADPTGDTIYGYLKTKGLNLSGDPAIRIDVVETQEGQPPVLILNNFQALKGLLELPQRQLDLLQHIFVTKNFWISLDRTRDLLRGYSTMAGTDPKMQELSDKLKAYKTNSNASFGTSSIRPGYVDILKALPR